jgi:hypothetical protein
LIGNSPVSTDIHCFSLPVWYNFASSTNKKAKQMKTITIIIAALLLQVNLLFASSDGVPVKETKEMNFNTLNFLAPVTPKEATFEETAPVPEILIPAPVTPKEATFEDEAEDININNLAPVTPSEADFSDDDPATGTCTIVLFPITPGEADFDFLP